MVTEVDVIGMALVVLAMYGSAANRRESERSNIFFLKIQIFMK